ncbi:MAG: L,D-transpeptidase [Chloroflexota bacterium]
MGNSNGGLSRRDFLKLSGLGLMGLLAPGQPLSFFSDPSTGSGQRLSPASVSEPPLQGRVAASTLWAHDAPSSKGKRVKLYWRDLVVNIDHTAIDEDTSAYNRVWYKLMDGGYLYSGWVQPVRTILNETVKTIPQEGLLGEVSVPFTDAYESPDTASKVVYRLYYETTHWVLGSVPGPDGSDWYRLLDDKYEQFYFVPARHVRIFPREELEPISPSVPPREKRIEIRLREQLVLAYEAKRVVFAARAATGAVLQVGTYTTPVGTFETYHKRPSRHMAAGDITASGFDLPGVPWVMYIKDNGVSLHGTYWHNDFGQPRSHGCVNLSPFAAKWLYRWTMPSVLPEKQYKYEYANATRVDVVE